MPEELIVQRKKMKGEDGHKVFSVRLTEEIVAKLDAIAEQTNRSRNELINLLLEYAIRNCRIQ
ncbi:MAG: ribbon-helix-helix protein, CopG family [Clostridia bacterium]|nr:ribbon-helix-helix protein, CopG family [Clostridia bacterium]